MPKDPEHKHTNDDPVPAIVVDDVRDTGVKRASIIAVMLLLLFFAVAAYKQAVKNGDRKIPAPIVTVQPASPSVTPVPYPSPVPGPDRVVVVPSVAPGTSPAPPRASAPGRSSPAPRASQKPPPNRPPSRPPSPRPSPIVKVCVRGIPCVPPQSIRLLGR